MSDFIFENAEDLELEQIHKDHFDRVTAAWLYSESGNAGILMRKNTSHNNKWAKEVDGQPLKLAYIYRVLAKPYTLDDALSDIDSLQDNRDRTVAVSDVHSIMKKLAASMGGGK